MQKRVANFRPEGENDSKGTNSKPWARDIQALGRKTETCSVRSQRLRTVRGHAQYKSRSEGCEEVVVKDEKWME